MRHRNRPIRILLGGLDYKGWNEYTVAGIKHNMHKGSSIELTR